MRVKKIGNKGITLVALVVTIIVLLILAAVTINFSLGENGIVTRTKYGKSQYNTASLIEKIKVDLNSEKVMNRGKLYDDTLKTILEKYGNVNEENGEVKSITTDKGLVIAIEDIWDGDIYKRAEDNVGGDNVGGDNDNGGNDEESGGAGDTTVVRPDSCVGYYADVYGDGSKYGIIFIDFAAEQSGRNQWGNSYGTYSISKKDPKDVKEYVVTSQTHTEPGFGTKPIVKLKNSSDSREDRFFIMALNDVGVDQNCFWYFDVSAEGMDEVTDTNIESGKTNTNIMRTKWNASEFGTQNAGRGNKDLWGLTDLVTEIGKGWFVPSKEEWAAFAGELGINSNYSTYNLKGHYWSSSQALDIYFDSVWAIGFYDGNIDDYEANMLSYVRLARTF